MFYSWLCFYYQILQILSNDPFIWPRSTPHSAWSTVSSVQTNSITANRLTNKAAVLLVGVNVSMWPAWPFVCDLCSPVPSISWRRVDGNPLPGKIKINHSSGVLEIPYFRPEDAGVYECVAENSRGRNVARGQLLFHSKNHVYTFLPVSWTWLLISSL